MIAMNDRSPPKPTSGQWKSSGIDVSHPSSPRRYAVIETADGAHRIAALQSDLPDEECLANARLISASPDLLDVAETAARIFRTYEMLHATKTPPDEEKAARNRQYAEFCEYAIARATGA